MSIKIAKDGCGGLDIVFSGHNVGLARDDLIKLAAAALSLIPEFAEIGENLLTQDNRLTDKPIFVVQEATEIYADGEILGPCEHDRGAWFDGEGNGAEGRRLLALEARYERDHTTEWKGWRRCTVGTIYTTKQPFFTEAAAKQYLKINGHNIRRPRIYADGSYRNAEFQLIRSLLMAVGKFTKEEVKNG